MTEILPTAVHWEAQSNGTASVTLQLPVTMVGRIQELADPRQLHPNEVLAWLINKWNNKLPPCGLRRQPCPTCHRLLLVGGKRQRRRDKIYCSDACRTRHHRERQTLARQMAFNGRSYREIAKELGSKVETVRYWVTGHRN